MKRSFIYALMLILITAHGRPACAPVEPERKSHGIDISCSSETLIHSSLFEYFDSREIRNDYEKKLDEGDSFFREGLFEEARLMYEESLILEGVDENVFLRLGDLSIRRGDYESAENHFEKALNINRENKYALFGMADVHMEKGSYEKALGLLEESLKIDVDFAQAYTTMGDIHVDVENYDKALFLFQKSLEIMPEQKFPDTYIGLGELYLAKNEYLKSLDYFKEAISRDPFDICGFMGAFKAGVNLGRFVEAEKYLGRCLILNKNDFEVKIAQVIYLGHTGEFTQANALLDSMEREQNNSEQMEDVKLLRAKLEKMERGEKSDLGDFY